MSVAAVQQQAAEYFRTLQDVILAGLAEVEKKPFLIDDWDYHKGSGGGRTRVLSEGTFFEKAGVNFSDVSGVFPEDFAAKLPGDSLDFRACGVSLVLHPNNPFVPTVHANFRCITQGSGDDAAGWLGGGADLTPVYPFDADCVHFHTVWKGCCDRHAVADHARFKTWCDEYFFIPHRNEARGIGGIFFDYLKEDPDAAFAFVRDCGDRFLESYLPIARRRGDLPYAQAQRDFQLYRRGRYVEFNLVYDRGTTFGLRTGGRIESILMSLPLNAKWLYDYQPAPGSREAELPQYLRPRDWAT